MSRVFDDWEAYSGEEQWGIALSIGRLSTDLPPLKLIQRYSASTAQQQLNELFNAIEMSKVPVVAALTGSALGGGFELALACHHRVALGDARVQLGLPEVNLGVFPGAGGTQRLPRLVGFQKAAELIMQGKITRGNKAQREGLVHDTAETAEEVHAKAAAWIEANPRFKQPWRQDGFRWIDPAPGTENARNLFFPSHALRHA